MIAKTAKNKFSRLIVDGVIHNFEGSGASGFNSINWIVNSNCIHLLKFDTHGFN